MWPLLVALLSVWLFYSLADVALTPPSMPYTEFKNAVVANQVSEVHVSDQSLTGTWKDPARARQEPNGFLVYRVDDPALLSDLSTHGVKVVGVPSNTLWHQLLTWGVPAVLLFMLMGRTTRNLGGLRGGLAAAGRSKPRMYMEKDIPVRFSDVAGVDEAKEELREVLEFLRKPERFARVGGKMPRGILLAGPPGTGKTLLARAVAGEAGVPFFSISGSEFVEMFVGVGAARVRDLFEQARAKAPCIIFIDELDALGKVRGMGPGANEEREQTLNQLLVELDGFDPRSGVVLMAATNRPEILDPALLRAGRFDRHVVVDRPDRTGRLAILQVHARDVALSDPKDLEDIAGMTAGMVGADLANIVNEAALQSVRRDHEKVLRSDLEEAVERVVAGLARKSRALSPEEKRRVAWHEVGHAIVGLQMGGTELKKISILPRGISALGYTIQLPTQDRFLMTQTELENRLATLLGGRAAEALVFNELSTGAQDDLQKATDIARAMVRTYGMSEALGPISLQEEPQSLLLGLRSNGHATELSDAVAREVDAEMRRILDMQFQRATAVLSTRMAALDAGAKALLEKETISGEDLMEILKKNPEAEVHVPTLAS